MILFDLFFVFCSLFISVGSVTRVGLPVSDTLRFPHYMNKPTHVVTPVSNFLCLLWTDGYNSYGHITPPRTVPGTADSIYTEKPCLFLRGTEGKDKFLKENYVYKQADYVRDTPVRWVNGIPFTIQLHFCVSVNDVDQSYQSSPDGKSTSTIPENLLWDGQKGSLRIVLSPMTTRSRRPGILQVSWESVYRDNTAKYGCAIALVTANLDTGEGVMELHGIRGKFFGFYFSSLRFQKFAAIKDIVIENNNRLVLPLLNDSTTHKNSSSTYSNFNDTDEGNGILKMFISELETVNTFGEVDQCLVLQGHVGMKRHGWFVQWGIVSDMDLILDYMISADAAPFYRGSKLRQLPNNSRVALKIDESSVTAEDTNEDDREVYEHLDDKGFSSYMFPRDFTGWQLHATSSVTLRELVEFKFNREKNALYCMYIWQEKAANVHAVAGFMNVFKRWDVRKHSPMLSLYPFTYTPSREDAVYYDGETSNIDYNNVNRNMSSLQRDDKVSGCVNLHHKELESDVLLVRRLFLVCISVLASAILLSLLVCIIQRRKGRSLDHW